MEKWKDIEGYEGSYQVSDEGNVKSLKFGKECILKSANRGNGYLFVHLSKDGKVKQYSVHRLVASAFLENPDSLPQVNHKDECKTNNNVDNLEWCTAEYNINYGTHNQKISEAQTNRTDRLVPIVMLTKENKYIGQFPSSKEAEKWLRANGLPKASKTSICKCCKGKRDTAYGYKWNYLNNF